MRNRAGEEPDLETFEHFYFVLDSVRNKKRIVLSLIAPLCDDEAKIKI